MGRMNRSRKRKAQMDRIKKERNAKKELLRLKKTLGLLDEHGNELIKKVEDVVEYKTPEQLKKVGDCLHQLQMDQIYHVLIHSYLIANRKNSRKRRRNYCKN